MTERKPTIPGLHLEECISVNGGIDVYRGRIEGESDWKIIKIADVSTIVKLEHECRLLRNLQGKGISICYGLNYYPGGVALILQDMGKNTLVSELVKRGSFDPVAGLLLGLRLTEVMGGVHNQKIIHKDINPSNIVFSEDITKCALIDFCKAIPFSRENSRFRALPYIEGTLAYMAPEQTGRVNREIDYRADYYAFGVTLYQIFTGRLPFESDDPLELLHGHIAIMPPPADKLKPQLPGYISLVLTKLLAKSADDRYQTIEGMRADLQTCLDKVRSGNSESFELGRADGVGMFSIPQKLYGRDAEKDQVLANFKTVEFGGNCVLLIGGLSGIGKTALIRETHPEITRCGGYYCEGKFDQLGRNTPYSALVQACNRLLEQTLLSDNSRIDYWKEKLSVALGHNGQVMVDILPALKPYVECEPLEQLGPQESQNRFKYVFTRFLKIFCTPEHPVVLFLDDLQWMDLGTLRLLEHIVTAPEIDHFLLVGCFRSNELHETHPLRDIMKGWEKQDVDFCRLELDPLGEEAVTEMLSDIFPHLSSDRDEFTEFILNRTDGNPFFLRQFLSNLYQEERIWFNRATKEWQVNLKALEHHADDGIVEFMVHQLEKLPERTRRALHSGACIGNEFDIPMLALTLGELPGRVQDYLFAAVEAGLLVPDLSSQMSIAGAGDDSDGIITIYRSYRFQHDRIQQASLLLGMVDKRTVHRKIGEKLLEDYNHEPEQLFTLIEHLNKSGWEEEATANREELFLLNMDGAEAAVKATSYESASSYLQKAVLLLPKKEWLEKPEQAFHLCHLMAEVRYLLGFHEDATEWMDKSLALSSNNLEKATVYNLKLIQQGLIGNYWESLETAFTALDLLGVSIDYHNAEEAIGKVFKVLSEQVNIDNIQDVYNRPDIENTEISFALKIISEIMSVSYAVDKRIFVLINLTSVQLSLKYGMSADAAGAFSCAGLLHIAMFGKPELGIAYGELGKKLGDRFDELGPRSKAYDFYCNFVVPWAYPLSLTEPLNREAFSLALDTGDLPFAGFIVNHRAYNSYYMGQPLQQVLDDSKRYLQFCDRISHHYAFDCVQGVIWAIEYLQTEDKQDTTLPDSREAFLSLARAPESPFPVSRYLILLMQIHILETEGEKAWRLAQAAENLQEHVTGTISSAEYRYYRLLAGLMFCNELPESEQEEFLEPLRVDSTFFSEWAQRNPHTFGHKDFLLKAEIAALEGRMKDALQNFDAAIDCARKNGFTHEEALSCERAAFFWERGGKKRLVPTYIREAFVAHRKWGCGRRAEALRKQYPELQQKSQTTESTVSESIGGRTGKKVMELDELLRSVAVISEAGNLTQLNKNALKLLMEGGGADIGALFIRSETELQLTAYASVEEQKIHVKLPEPVPVNEVHENLNIPIPLLNSAEAAQRPVIINSYEDLRTLLPDRRELILSDRREKLPKSMICLPVLRQGELLALVYLGNTVTEQAFTLERLKLMQALSGQLSVSIENAMLYEELESLVVKRTEALEAANSQLKRLSNLDGLTQLYNRRYFDQALEMEIDRANRSNSSLSLLMCDIDHFKKFNDYYGHVAGDHCIRSVAKLLLQSCGRTTDIAARYGGEEFVLILPDTEAKGALSVTKRIFRELERENIPHIGSENKDIVSLSIGIASLVPDHGCTALQFIAYADEALYESKRTGRDRVTVKNL